MIDYSVKSFCQVWSSCIILCWNKTFPRPTFSRIFLIEIYIKHNSWVSKYLLSRFWAKLNASKAKSTKKLAKYFIAFNGENIFATFPFWGLLVIESRVRQARNVVESRSHSLLLCKHIQREGLGDDHWVVWVSWLFFTVIRRTQLKFWIWKIDYQLRCVYVVTPVKGNKKRFHSPQEEQKHFQPFYFAAL